MGSSLFKKSADVQLSRAYFLFFKLLSYCYEPEDIEMKNRTEGNEKFVIQLVGEEHKNASPIELDEEDLKKFRTAPLLVSALKNALGGRLGQPKLIGASIEIEVVPDTSEIPYSMESFVEDLKVTAAELKRNANLENPLAHGVAVTKPILTKVLRALEAGCNDFGTEVLLQIGDKFCALPVVSSSDFTEPDKNENTRKPDTFLIVGLRRDDSNGHCLIVTNNDLFVRLPRDDPYWAWANICEVLEKKTWLEGSLYRESKGHAWKPGESAKLVEQDRLNNGNA